MLLALLLSLILTWLHLTILAILSTQTVVWQLVIVSIVLAFRYKKNNFGWQVALFGGLLFDLFSGLNFGVFTLLFLAAAMASELALSLPERWGLTLTTVGLTALLTIGYVAITGLLIGSMWSTILLAAPVSAIITSLTMYLIANLLDRFTDE